MEDLNKVIEEKSLKKSSKIMLKDLFQRCVSKILFSLQLALEAYMAHSFRIRPLLPPACSRSARSSLPRQHLLAATICSNSVFKHFSCCHFDSNTSSNSRKKCTRLMDLSPSDIPLQKLENSIPRPNACL